MIATARRLIPALTILLAATGGLSAQEAELHGLVVRGLSFEGNHAIDDYTLRNAIGTTNSSVLVRSPLFRWLGIGEKRFFDETEFRRDVLRIVLLYRQTGYFQARVDTIVRRSETDVRIRMLIDEGRPIRIRSLTVTGDSGVAPIKELTRDLPITEGAPFNRLLVNAAAESLRVKLRNRGYPFADVFRSFEENRDALTASVKFELVPGPLARVEKVDIAGTATIPERVIRRAISVHPGQPFRQNDLYASQRDLYRMDVFNYVDVGLVDSIQSGPDDSLVSVRVQLADAALHRVRAGGGFGTIDCFRGLAAWTGRNFLGGGRSLDVEGRLSKIGATTGSLQHTACRTLHVETNTPAGLNRLKLNYNLSVTLRDPLFLMRNTTGSFSLFAERRSEIEAFLRTAVGGEVGLTRRVADIPVTLSYTIARGYTEAEPVVYCVLTNVCDANARAFAAPRWQGTYGIGLVRDRANSPLDPSRGTLLSIQLRHSSKVSGSDTLSRFNKGVVDLSGYVPVSRRAVFAWRFRGGVIFGTGGGLQGQAIGLIPPEERFYAGGPTTVRGFSQNELGDVVRVVDPAAGSDSLRTSPIGGNQLLLANVELRFPLPGFGGRLRGAMFVDAGRVIERRSSLLSTATPLVTPGVGVRVATPLGPIRLDVAYNGYDIPSAPRYQVVGDQLQPAGVDPPTSRGGFGSRLKWHFAVGQAF